MHIHMDGAPNQHERSLLLPLPRAVCNDVSQSCHPQPSSYTHTHTHTHTHTRMYAHTDTGTHTRTYKPSCAHRLHKKNVCTQHVHFTVLHRNLQSTSEKPKSLCQNIFPGPAHRQAALCLCASSARVELGLKQDLSKVEV